MRSRTRTTAACAATVLALTALPAAAGTATAAPAGTAAPVGRTADFNNDGYPDLAIGAHTAPVGDIARAGLVSIAYGSPTGLRFDTASIVSQATPGVPGDAVTDGRWREVSGFGDLDHDGYDDLVVSWNNHNTVLWGGPTGITGAGTLLPSAGTAAAPRLLGGSGVGDVNGDGIDDYVSKGVVGSPVDPVQYDGVAVLLGPLNRATGQPAGRWFRDSRSNENALTTLHVDDMTGDGIADVALSGGSSTGTSANWVLLKGSAAGLVKGSSFVGPYASETNRAVVGDLDRDGYGDLVTGIADRNQVYVVQGGPNGFGATRRLYTQDTPGVPGVDEEYDYFGSALAVGDTDRDGYPDLVIGAKYETGADPVASYRSGAITVLRGSATGLTTTGAKVLTQNSSGVPSTSERTDYLGNAVTVVDTDRDGSPEVYVGGNGEDGFKGRVWRLPTGATGVTGTGSTSFHLGSLGGPTAGGNFGYRMAG
ncbi:FG-GAP and VCBS repeat-containing protein [Micromonospora sp. NPDC000089]|uniref:FG-GAP and VCBS repeat-containing protein n=1 Tax=unclassified Micromonospora TaxID=2617518 RepID=UPI0036CD6C48